MVSPSNNHSECSDLGSFTSSLKDDPDKIDSMEKENAVAPSISHCKLRNSRSHISELPLKTLSQNEVLSLGPGKMVSDEKSTGDASIISQVEKPATSSNAGPSTAVTVLLPRALSSEEPEDHESPADDSDLDHDYVQPESDSTSTTSEETASNSEKVDKKSDVHLPARKSRKRQRKSATWLSNERKLKRAAGEEYISKKKKRVPPRKIKDACKSTCKLKCSQVFTNEDREKIFKQYWSATADNNVKRQFVASSITVQPIQRRRERTGQKNRDRSLLYHFLKNDRTIRVCKVFFLNTLCISQTCVETALAKRCSEGGVVTEDFRGKHPPPNKICDEVRQKIREHILRFPTEESHYRRENSSKKYLDSSLSIAKMYELYVEDSQEQNIPPDQIAKMWLYNEIFNKEFNYSFKKPYNDTCDSCDNYLIQLRDASTNEEKQRIQKEYNLHLDDATERYKLKKADKDISREDPTQKVIMVDLEKCLPTPVLTNAQSFYSLKLWTFNYTIHDSTEKHTYCCMFDESIANRGVNEMASCLIKWIDSINLPPTLRKLTIWSDNCPSQNRNFGMIMCYFFILEKCPQLEIVEHKFLVRGHTHLEADSAHSLIEREWKRQTQFKIMVPWDWQQLVRICSRKNPFTVISMEKSDFINIKSLYEGPNAPFVIRKKASTNDPFLISHVVHLQV
ncbi:unnamed protein product, partial [Callosobruchus maculatus]